MYRDYLYNLFYGVPPVQRTVPIRGMLPSKPCVSIVYLLMHMRGNPHNMMANTDYKDVVSDVWEYLQNRIKVCINELVVLEGGIE